MLEVLISVLVVIGLLAAMIVVGIGAFRALKRRTLDASRPSIIFGLVTAVTTSLLVFVLVYLSAWAELRQQIATGKHGVAKSDRRTVFLSAQAALSDYALKHGHYPDTVENVPELEDRIPLDPWLRPYQYRKTEDGFTLLSLGRDGKRGGIGIDADFFLDEEGGPPIEPTLSQFLFEAEGGGRLFIVAFLASCFAGLACYIASRPRDGWPVAVGPLLITTVISAVGAVVVSLILVSVYLFGLPH